MFISIKKYELSQIRDFLYVSYYEIGLRNDFCQEICYRFSKHMRIFSRLFFVFLMSVFVIGSIQPAWAQTTATTKKGIPFVGPITPRTAVRNYDVPFSVRVSDNEILKSCQLYVNGVKVKDMIVKRDVSYVKHKFTTNGEQKLFARCVDADNNTVDGKEVTVTVSGSSTHVASGDLIKIGCTGNVYPNDPCTAVYYYGVDGRRHAFPNERVFLSWYKNFDELVIVSAKAMSEIPLGRNVIYRPGQRLVKFIGKTVYAIAYAGLLRPIANGQIAEAIYGKDWVSYIQGVDDVFYTNYRIGVTIESTNDFVWKYAEEQVTSIDEVLF